MGMLKHTYLPDWFGPLHCLSMTRCLCNSFSLSLTMALFHLCYCFSEIGSYTIAQVALELTMQSLQTPDPWTPSCITLPRAWVKSWAITRSFCSSVVVTISENKYVHIQKFKYSPERLSWSLFFFLFLFFPLWGLLSCSLPASLTRWIRRNAWNPENSVRTNQSRLDSPEVSFPKNLNPVRFYLFPEVLGFL